MNKKLSNLDLIILYGGVCESSSHAKVQALIDGKLTCGYRDYARCSENGLIVYMTPQSNLNNDWEISIPQWQKVVDLCNKNKNARVWSVKYDTSKNEILSSINNFKMHYSCCAKNTYDELCDISFVDTTDRVTRKEHRLLVKGKDPDFWSTSKTKKYDYLVCGTKDNKNQSYFINSLNSIKGKRSVLWIGGKPFSKKIKSKHNVTLTSPLGPEEIAKLIPQCKVGILFTEIKAEGFPQTFLEMTMCGLPVVYHGPINKSYIHPGNCNMPKKKKRLLEAAENYLANYDSYNCRQIAIDNYSIQKSLELLRTVT